MMQPPNHQILGCCIDQLRAPALIRTIRLFHAPPLELARSAAAWVRKITEGIDLERFLDSLQRPLESFVGGRSIPDVSMGPEKYLEAMRNVLQTFAVRVTVLGLSTPVFALFGLVGLAEGLMRRDLRRWGGGRESSFVYHHSRKLLGPSILSAWMLYLAAPFSVHPNLVLLPFATVFAVGVAVTTATFKKYL
jgi:hypothetical protein